MKNAEAKIIYLLKHQSRTNRLLPVNDCPACNKEMVVNDMTFQHCASNHLWRRKKFPLFIDSILNLKLICLDCNVYKHRSFGKISDYRAERYEKFLERHPRIADWVNDPS